MSKDLTHIIKTLRIIEKENERSEDLMHTLSFLVELLNTCSESKNRTAKCSRLFKLDRLTIKVEYNGYQTD
jgi:thymidylate synthase ThyX